MLEDKLLIWKLKRGNKDGLRLLYEKYKDELRTIAGSMLHGTQATEDVLHDVFVAFAENARHLQIRTSLKNYLITCVVNRVRDEFRRRQSQTIELDRAGPVSVDSNYPERQLEADEESRILTDALAAIPFEQREVIVLHLKGEFKFREIAKMQQTSLSTVHGRYRYGLKKLNAILDGELEK
ncbi:MAG: RNA polymerase sigma factor [Planctomycetota bacterium]|nr:MAG: RNA polymerase sigma factor [Planctomycetota bacterium]